MLWSPNEVLAYLKDDSSSTSQKETHPHMTSERLNACFTLPPDFILIAENSEVHGPNSLFTIPLHHEEIDANVISTRILSADYQELGRYSKKAVSLSHSQVVMPDIFENTHVAVNHFVLFDSEARGYVRPTCIAYVTSDKSKLICFAETILSMLSEASCILQHSNIATTSEDLRSILQAAKNSSHGESLSKNQLPAVSNFVVKDIEEIVNVINEYKGNDTLERNTLFMTEFIKKGLKVAELKELFNSFCDFAQQTQPKTKKNSEHQKDMKSLFTICGNGFILSLYHLYLMHKHFKRKYENMALLENCANLESKGTIYYGACIKSSKDESGKFLNEKCILRTFGIPETSAWEKETYFNWLDTSFEHILLDFFNRENNCVANLHLNSVKVSCGPTDIAKETDSKCSTNNSCSFEKIKPFKENACKHVVELEKIWDVLEEIEAINPGAESAFLEILKLFDDTKRILYSILTRTPIIIISTPAEVTTAQNFVKAISLFIPRKKEEVLFVDVDREVPLTKENLNYIAAANICIKDNRNIEEFIPNYLWHSLCILNLKNCSLTAPTYSGVLLSDVDERYRVLPLEGPAFPVTIGILCEIQSALDWWLLLASPSVDSHAASSSILSKEFSRSDVQILVKLSKLCSE